MAENRDDVLVIRVARSGGVAGIPRTGILELHAQDPGHEQEASWISIARDALDELRALEQAKAPSPVRDAFTWSLSIDGEDHSVPDTLLTGPARTLAEHVIALPRRP
jgi:hypothetical protein